jgi:Fe-Mn family superoxide dismutase
MKQFAEQKFNINELTGISKTNIEEHLKLYAGYVKHANLILEKISSLSENIADNGFLITELQRRFSFEFNGIRNHEIFFSALSDSAQPITVESSLYQKICAEWGSFEKWLELFKQIAKTRGIGWAVLYYDKQSDRLLNGWIDEQHLGQLNSAVPVLMIDMWEHSFVSDYQPSGKGKYIEDFFVNLNWFKIEDNYNQAVK